jgi:hypothetical protein
VTLSWRSAPPLPLPEGPAPPSPPRVLALACRRCCCPACKRVQKMLTFLAAYILQSYSRCIHCNAGSHRSMNIATIIGAVAVRADLLPSV